MNVVPLRPPMTREAAGTLLGQTVGLVVVAADLFAVGAHLGRTLSSQWVAGVHRRILNVFLLLLP